ncbi:MAG: hypothetical protein OEW06_01720, partial [Gemmatimonadota bacterium]|nr:hypothetical protein [Gemmatimonadota bacterium]
MTDPLAPIVAERNPSVPLAVAAVLQVADAGGRVTFGDLAVAYRERYLEVARGAGYQRGTQLGTLSVDEVRRFLVASVLPRLVTDELLETLPDVLDDGAVLQVSTMRWTVLEPERAQAIARLLAIAIERLAEAESLGEAAGASGSVLSG